MVPNRPHTIQLSQAKDMQCLETEAIEEEGKDHLFFLALPVEQPYRLALQKPMGSWWPPYTCSWGTCTFGYSAKHSPQVSSTQHESTPPIPHFTTTMLHPGPCLDPNSNTPSLGQAVSLSQLEGIGRGVSEEPPHSKEKGWDASSQSIDGELVGSLCQGFRSRYGRQERTTSRQTILISIAKPHVTWWTCFCRTWLHLPASYIPKSMRSRRSGEGGVSCDMPTMY